MSDEGLTMDMVSTRTFELYQLKSASEEPEPAVLRYMSYDWLKAHGFTVNPKNYELVYSGELDSDARTDVRPDWICEALFRQFNNFRPADFTGRSMSCSDVVVLNEDGRRTAWYCDRIGFRQIEWRDG